MYFREGGYRNNIINVKYFFLNVTIIISGESYNSQRIFYPSHILRYSKTALLPLLQKIRVKFRQWLLWLCGKNRMQPGF